LATGRSPSEVKTLFSSVAGDVFIQLQSLCRIVVEKVSVGTCMTLQILD
jgi:hypothetical protein